jgi:hypothetical protein
MVIWSESLDRIVPTCNDFEDRLIKLLWRSRTSAAPSSTLASHSTPTPSILSSPSAEALHVVPNTPENITRRVHRQSIVRSPPKNTTPFPEQPKEKTPSVHTRTIVKRNWYGKKIGVFTTSEPEKADLEQAMDDDQEVEDRDKRPVQLYAPLYNGLAAGLSLGAFHLVFI